MYSDERWVITPLEPIILHYPSNFAITSTENRHDMVFLSFMTESGVSGVECKRQQCAPDR
jgi:hypothetical protein